MSIQKISNLSVGDVMLPLDRCPVIGKTVIMKEAMEAMNRARLGIACIVDNNMLLGILTDGDIRRKLLKIQKPLSALFIDDAIKHSILAPITISSSDTLQVAIDLMDNKQIWDLPVVDDNGTLIGLLHLHRAVKVLLEMKD